MKRFYSVLSIIAVLASCNREAEPEMTMQTLTVHGASYSKVTINDAGKSVWQTGDCVSVFMDGGENELWTYVGADGAVSGNISHPFAFRPSDKRKVALYPYDASFAQTGMTVAGDFPVSRPLLYAATTGSDLHFSYLTAAVVIKFDTNAEIKSVTLQGNDGELVGGKLSIDVSGDKAVLSLTDREPSVGYGPVKSDRLWISIPPISFTKGFEVTVTYPDNSTQKIRYTEPVEFVAGSVVELGCCCEYISASDVMFIDFRETCPFPGFPDGSNATAMHTDGTYYFNWEGIDYPFYFHAGPYYYPEGHQSAGQPEYGYRWTTASKVKTKCKSLLIGRDGSYIKLPAVKGKTLVRFEAMMGNDGNGWYLSLDSAGGEPVSGKPTEVGPDVLARVDVDYFQKKANTPIYLYQTGGNLVFLWWKLYFQ